MSSTGERAGASRVRLRRPAVIAPPPRREPVSAARTLLAWFAGFDLLIVALVIFRPSLLSDLFPGSARPAVLQVGFGAALLILGVASFAAWRLTMHLHRAALAEADGVDR